MHLVDVISGVRFGDIPVGVVELPLANTIAGVITGYGRGRCADLRQEAHLHGARVEIAADVGLLQHKLTRPLALRGAAQTVIDGVPVIVNVVHVSPDFGAEILAIQNLILVARHRVHPGEIRERKRGL